MSIREVFLGEDPIPVGIRVGDLVHLVRLTNFQELSHAVQAAGASLDNVAQVSFFVRNREDLRDINPPWLEMFPDENDRPTYKFMLADEPMVEAFAVAGQRRRPLHIPNVAHTNPIPMGVRIGDYLFSSRVLPYDPATGQAVEGVDRQAECLFQNVRALLEVGDMQPAHIRQGRLFLSDLSYQAVAERHWQALTHNAVLDVTRYTLAPSLLVMLEVIAARRA
jgi:2-iminobutanoate/2-iminopropanoate deaminase